MRRRSVSGNTSPNAGFLLVRAESRSSTKVSPRFHYAQAQCFQWSGGACPATKLLGFIHLRAAPSLNGG